MNYHIWLSHGELGNWIVAGAGKIDQKLLSVKVLKIHAFWHLSRERNMVRRIDSNNINHHSYTSDLSKIWEASRVLSQILYMYNRRVGRFGSKYTLCAPLRYARREKGHCEAWSSRLDRDIQCTFGSKGIAQVAVEIDTLASARTRLFAHLCVGAYTFLHTFVIH